MASDERDASFVPSSFEDLRRDARANRPELPLAEQKSTSRDLHDLVAERGFMQRSGLIAAGAVAVGAVLILVAYARPMLDAFDAVHASSQMAADKAGQQLQGVQSAAGGLTSQAALVRSTDEKAISTAKGGLACLTGKTACPNGASPFK